MGPGMGHRNAGIKNEIFVQEFAFDLIMVRIGDAVAHGIGGGALVDPVDGKFSGRVDLMNFEAFDDFQDAAPRSARGNVFEVEGVGGNDEGFAVFGAIDVVQLAPLATHGGIDPVGLIFVEDFDDGVVEGGGAGQVMGDLVSAVGIDENGKGIDAEMAKQGTEEGGLVLAITVASFEDGGHVVGFVAMFTNGNGNVTDIVLDEAEGLLDLAMPATSSANSGGSSEGA